MLEVPVYNMEGEQVETLEIDENLLGGSVNVNLLKQAMVNYQAAAHQGTAATRSRGMVAGSTRKLFRQKGTGYARRGAIRTGLLRGGGVTFAKTPRPPRKRLPKKMRRAALRSAVLAKALGGDLVLLDALSLEAPRTKVMAGVVEKLGINRTCTLATRERDRNVYLSARNLPDVTVRVVEELNAYEVATRQKLLLTKDALMRLTGQEVSA